MTPYLALMLLAELTVVGLIVRDMVAFWRAFVRHHRRLPGTDLYYDPEQGVGADQLAEAVAHARQAVCLIWNEHLVDDALRDFSISIQPRNSWVDIYGRHVTGLTWLDAHTIEVGQDLIALAHEFAHVCEAYVDKVTPDSTHESWRRRGIEAAVKEYENWVLVSAVWLPPDLSYR